MLLTPNNDGENDQLKFTEIAPQLALQFPNNELVIYTRWGDIIFQKKGYDNDWKGDYNGSTLPDGTYYFTLQLNDNMSRSYKGYILIVH